MQSVVLVVELNYRLINRVGTGSHVAGRMSIDVLASAEKGVKTVVDIQYAIIMIFIWKC